VYLTFFFPATNHSWAFFYFLMFVCIGFVWNLQKFTNIYSQGDCVKFTNETRLPAKTWKKTRNLCERHMSPGWNLFYFSHKNHKNTKCINLYFYSVFYLTFHMKSSMFVKTRILCELHTNPESDNSHNLCEIHTEIFWVWDVDRTNKDFLSPKNW
jgi:hypothetical protein